MADRVLRGSRLGAVSYETDRDHDLAPRRMARYQTPNGVWYRAMRRGARSWSRYQTPNGEVYEVPFADDAEIPGTWMCKNGQEGQLIDGPAVEVKKGKPPRTHWDMLLERRSLEELEELLKERMDLLKKRRRAGAR